MLFEIIDQKENCTNIVSHNKIISNPEYLNLTKTWAYHPSLKDLNIQYASLYANGKSLNDCCPDHLIEEWESVKKKHLAFIKSFSEAKVRPNDHCFYDLVPASFVAEYFTTKSKITDHVLSTYPKPKNYDFLLGLMKMTSEIRTRKMNVNLGALANKLHDMKVRSFRSKIQSCDRHVDYNIFGTITGRLTTKKNSFPLLTMNKDYRSVVVPNNDWFVELDFNAAELRCMLAINDRPQPSGDIHDWHSKIMNELSDDDMDRDRIKGKIFKWLYGPLNHSLGIPKIEEQYNKNQVIEKCWDGERVVNHFGREITSDKFHALNMIIQSTTSDLFLRRAIAINKLLSGKKSYIMGLIHDSVVIDFSKEDKALLKDLVSEFSDTDLGTFKVNTSLGTDFGNMRRFELG